MPEKLVLRLPHGAPPPPADLRFLLGRRLHRDLLSLDDERHGGELAVAGYVARPTGELLDVAGSPTEVYLLERPAAG
ncbi:MAG: hypothetical protein ACOYXW_10485 [Actinomycetota bacterium]